MIYSVGIVLYTPSTGRYIEDPYEIGDVFPIICYFTSPEIDRQVIWLENTIEGLKVGDPIAFSLVNEKMFPIEVIEGLGVRAIGLDF